MDLEEWLDREDWLVHGFKQGWISPPVCAIHDGDPMTEAEAEEINEPNCFDVIRLYASPEEKKLVEEYDSASMYRGMNRGWFDGERD